MAPAPPDGGVSSPRPPITGRFAEAGFAPAPPRGSWAGGSPRLVPLPCPWGEVGAGPGRRSGAGVHPILRGRGTDRWPRTRSRGGRWEKAPACTAAAFPRTLFLSWPQPPGGALWPWEVTMAQRFLEAAPLPAPPGAPLPQAAVGGEGSAGTPQFHLHPGSCPDGRSLPNPREVRAFPPPPPQCPFPRNPIPVCFWGQRWPEAVKD